MTLRSAVKSLVKQVAFSTPLHRTMFNVYPFMYTPAELVYLGQCLTEVQFVPGSIVEAGCAYGATTVWLNHYMDDYQIERNYYALDTFSGFPRDHVEYESVFRHKSQEVQKILATNFADNKQQWFDKEMKLHNITRVKSVQCDIAEFDFTALAPIAFSLIDVDLYLPIRATLPNIYALTSPGGMIVVDDCWGDEKWDGALQAYEEFTFHNGLPRTIVCRKLGVINKPP